MNDKLVKDRHDPDFQPTCAADCGMEEAFGLGFLSDPTPETRPTHKLEKYPLARTDFVKNEP